ncbi:hypothetical protein HON22_02780 [Candidatus Peregrinibacteria bacterium]|jgi:hypothetical protein|nr:hypothetical protein [Candidatus Peregrinibacteria bacterium]
MTIHHTDISAILARPETLEEENNSDTAVAADKDMAEEFGITAQEVANGVQSKESLLEGMRKINDVQVLTKENQEVALA